LVGRGAIDPMLVHVQSKEENVDPVKLLEHNDALASKREFLRIVLVRVSLSHELTHFELPFHRCYLANNDRTA
jgi:hypothetical protein